MTTEVVVLNSEGEKAERHFRSSKRWIIQKRWREKLKPYECWCYEQCNSVRQWFSKAENNLCSITLAAFIRTDRSGKLHMCRFHCGRPRSEWIKTGRVSIQRMALNTNAVVRKRTISLLGTLCVFKFCRMLLSWWRVCLCVFVTLAEEQWQPVRGGCGVCAVWPGCLGHGRRTRHQ